MSDDMKRLLDLAHDRAALARKNPGVDAELLNQWAKMKRDRPAARREAHQYDLQRAFDDSAQRMVGVLHAQADEE